MLISSNTDANGYADTIVSRMSNVYDGDTFRVDIDQWPALIGNNTAMRFNNIDTPELRAQCPHEKRLVWLGKNFTETKLQQAGIIELRNLNRRQYFRITADVFIDGENLAECLLNAGFAKIYSGQHKSKVGVTSLI